MYLNATVNVNSIRVEVRNIVAKVNLDAKVMDLLEFSAGVDASIERVELRIDDVYARAELEVRLGNVVRMVDDVLGSIDLNPLIASLGKSVKKVVGAATDVVGGAADNLLGGGGANPAGLRPGPAAAGDPGTGGAAPRPDSSPSQQNAPPPGGAGGAAPRPDSGPNQQNAPPSGGAGAGPQNAPPIGTGTGPVGSGKPPPNPALSREPNMLWFKIDPATNGGTYEVLEQNGDVAKVAVDARGTELSRKVVGSYSNMYYTGAQTTVVADSGQVEQVFPFRYSFPDAVRMCYVYTDSTGRITRTQVAPWDGQMVRPSGGEL